MTKPIPPRINPSNDKIGILGSKNVSYQRAYEALDNVKFDISEERLTHSAEIDFENTAPQATPKFTPKPAPAAGKKRKFNTSFLSNLYNPSQEATAPSKKDLDELKKELKSNTNDLLGNAKA